MHNLSYKVVWILGLPSAGKSTLARCLQARIHEIGLACLMLDGDELRAGLCKSLGFSASDREENIRRAAEIAHLSAKSGILSVAAFITPQEVHRNVAQFILKDVPVLWVWAKCSREVCYQRDVKGLYRKHANGYLCNVTGADGEFEDPPSSFLQIDTENNDIEDSTNLIWNQLFCLDKPGCDRSSTFRQDKVLR